MRNKQQAKYWNIAGNGAILESSTIFKSILISKSWILLSDNNKVIHIKMYKVQNKFRNNVDAFTTLC